MASSLAFIGQVLTLGPDAGRRIRLDNSRLLAARALRARRSEDLRDHPGFGDGPVRLTLVPVEVKGWRPTRRPDRSPSSPEIA